MNRDQYVELLKNLFPTGAAWPRAVSSGFHKLFEAIAEEFVRFDTRLGVDLVNEADPQTTSELLTDWERIVRLPDDLQTELGPTVSQRRRDILRKLTFRGGQSRQFFVDLAAAFGYTVTIEETFPFRAGRNRAGDRCYDVDWIHHWRVKSDGEVSNWFRAGSGRSGDRIRTWSNDALEAVIGSAKPGQTVVHFVYGGS
jgi:uncharacterized protein YmfQ (DUF2313 family)